MDTKLPKLLSELVPVIGLEGAIKLAVAKGGRQVFIPSDAADAPWLIKALGEASARALCEHLRSYSFTVRERMRGSGFPIRIPLARRFRNRLLFEQARQMQLSIERTAAHCGVSERTVSYWRKRWPSRPAPVEAATTK